MFIAVLTCLRLLLWVIIDWCYVWWWFVVVYTIGYYVGDSLTWWFTGLIAYFMFEWVSVVG